MEIIKGGFWGVIGGLLYAFISFYFLTAILRNNFAAIAFYGLQGFIFGIVFTVLKLLNDKIRKKEGLRFFCYVTIGAIAGFFSCIHIVVITYYNAIIKSPGLVANEVRINIISQLIHFSIGCVLMGLIIGFLIGLFEQKETSFEKNP